MFEKAKSDPKVQELIRMKEEAEIEFGSKIANAKAEGNTEGKTAVAKRMLEEGLDSDLVARCSGLSASEVKKLIM